MSFVFHALCPGRTQYMLQDDNCVTPSLSTMTEHYDTFTGLYNPIENIWCNYLNCVHVGLIRQDTGDVRKEKGGITKY